jgi:hypothetical protein
MRSCPETNSPCAQDSWAPPAGREYPPWVGVEEPPDENRGGNDEQAEGLVAAEEAALFGAALVRGQLLLVGLDAAFDHACALFNGCAGRAGTPRISIGAVAVRILRRYDAGLIETFKQAGAGGVVDESGAEGFAVAGGELVVGPGEVFAEASVLLLEGHVGDGACVSVDAEGDAGLVEPIDAMFGVAGSRAGLYVAAGADFEVNARVCEMANEGGIFDAADAVADAGWLEVLERFPDAGGSAGFAGVGGAMEAVFDGVAKGWDVRGNWKSGFVAGDVEGGDAGAGELLDEVRGLEALFRGEVTEGAEDEAGLDTGGADALLGGAVDGGDDDFGG